MLGVPVGISIDSTPIHQVREEVLSDSFNLLGLRDLILIDACTSCGFCKEACPVTGAGEDFSPRDFVRSIGKRVFKPKDQKKENIWNCTACGACTQVCPIYASPMNAINESRRQSIEMGVDIPPLMISTLDRLYKYNNPWESSVNRLKWTEERLIPPAEEASSEGLCYFVGCTTSFETRSQNIARAFTDILNKAGVPFFVLGNREPCCGHIASALGEEGLFE
jgi:Fe-S oxidoreductase